MRYEVRYGYGGEGSGAGWRILRWCCWWSAATAEAPHWGEGEYRAALDDEAAVQRCLMVAEVEGRVVGFAVGKVAAGVGELESVAVAGSGAQAGGGAGAVPGGDGVVQGAGRGDDGIGGQGGKCGGDWAL